MPASSIRLAALLPPGAAASLLSRHLDRDGRGSRNFAMSALACRSVVANSVFCNFVRILCVARLLVAFESKNDARKSLDEVTNVDRYGQRLNISGSNGHAPDIE